MRRTQKRKKSSPWKELTRVSFHIDGLLSHEGRPNQMAKPHRHNEMELNYLDGGMIRYIIGEREFQYEAGALLLFWAGTPHQVIEVQPSSRHRWLSIPLPLCSSWQLPPSFLSRLFFGTFVLESDPLLGPLDQALMSRWNRDLNEGSEEEKSICLLEIQARLRRLAASHGGYAQSGASAERGPLQEAGAMLFFLAQNFQKSLRVQEVADAAGINANQAMRFFRELFGMSIMDYLTQLRLVHARSLLKNSNSKILDVALESGFSSLSSFYAAFGREAGKTPGSFRRRDEALSPPSPRLSRPLTGSER